MTRKVGTQDSAETAIVYAALVGTVATSLGTPLFGMRLPQHLFDWVLFLAIGLGFFATACLYLYACDRL